MEPTRPSAAPPASGAERGLWPPEPPGQPAPVVHVTIGRIEVRAASPRPAAPAAPPPPVMSLDDYVRQRTAERAR